MEEDLDLKKNSDNCFFVLFFFLLLFFFLTEVSGKVVMGRLRRPL